MRGYGVVIDSVRAQEIAEKYYEEIYSYCLTFMKYDKQATEEVVQETFLTFQLKCKELEDERIKRWLLRVGKYKAFEYLREKQKDMILVPLDESVLESDEKDIQTMIEDNFPENDEELQKYINIIMKALTPKERELYRKIFIEKKKYREIAEELNISEDAVTTRASRMKRRIRGMVKVMFSTVGYYIIRTFF